MLPKKMSTKVATRPRAKPPTPKIAEPHESDPLRAAMKKAAGEFTALVEKGQARAVAQAQARRKPRMASPSDVKRFDTSITITVEAQSFAETGRSAAKAAQRELLLSALGRCGWNLTAAAEQLSMGANSSVIRALKELAPEEYEMARASGRIAPGKPRGA